MKDKSTIEKIKHYCAYQERSHKEVRSKLLSLNVYGEELEQHISILIEENFLNEERYARSLARGKFRMKQWGRIKIEQALQQQNISSYCIRQAMTEIDEHEYASTLGQLARKKYESLDREEDDFVRKGKVIQHLVQKGYEYPLIQHALKRLQET